MTKSTIKTRTQNGRLEIFDQIRKKYVAYTPEEHVRQVFIDFIITEKQYPTGLISVENKVKNLYKKGRTDICIYNRAGEVLMIIECKAPDVKLTDKTFEQASRYNISLKASWLVITNGKHHYCAFIDHDKHSARFVEEIPDYKTITSL